MISRSVVAKHRVTLAIGAAFVFLVCLNRPTPWLAGAALGIGWLRHLVRLEKWGVVLLIATGVLTAFAVAVERQAKDPLDGSDDVGASNGEKLVRAPDARRPSRVVQSASVLGLLIFGFAAILSLAGMAQQASKLFRSPQPLVLTYPAYNALSASKNNLKQIGLSAHNYESRYRSFPGAGTFSETGRGRHSWMTFLLPYVDQVELYRRVNFAADWRAPANASVFHEPVACFSYPYPSGPREQSPARTPGLAAYAGNIRVLPPDRSLAIREITDGTSNTILAGEVISQRRAWGDPANLRDPARGVNHAPYGFGGPWSSSTQFIMCDGAVRRVSNDIDQEVLRRLGTPAGNDSDDADLGHLWTQ